MKVLPVELKKLFMTPEEVCSFLEMTTRAAQEVSWKRLRASLPPRHPLKRKQSPANVAEIWDLVWGDSGLYYQVNLNTKTGNHPLDLVNLHMRLGTWVFGSEDLINVGDSTLVLIGKAGTFTTFHFDWTEAENVAFFLGNVSIGLLVSVIALLMCFPLVSNFH